MPYTPPSHQSPATSTTTSPDVSRRPSIQSGPRPTLPRSASYLSKNRRTPLANGADASPSQIMNGLDDGVASAGLGSSVRQSPPPRADERELMPRGAIVSPPDSATSGSDDEESLEIQNRRSEVLKNLREAVSQISKTQPPEVLKGLRPLMEPFSSQIAQSPTTPHQHSISTGTTTPPLQMSLSASALSEMPRSIGRKNGHVRSATEPDASILKNSGSSLTVSEEESDEDLQSKPQMVRKKSGELVRPALRGHRRPSSMPGTPVFSKAVHFDSHLEHVRHFLQVDRPLAVSAGSSPAENYESDSEYPFPRGSRPGKIPPFEWELTMPNFPLDSLVRKSMPIRLEKAWLSGDQKSLLGSVAVVNLAFSKQITCRFTMDYWKTVSEVAAEYSHEIRPREGTQGQDRFTFSIKLSDTADLESKTLFFCVRYSVNGQEFWDNNNATNFQVDFKKKHLPQKGKNNFQGAVSKPLNGLPRSNRRQNSGSGLRPMSLPASLDAFGNGMDVFKFDQPIHEYLGESDVAGGLRFKSKSSSSLASDNFATDMVSPSGVAFSNRYDFSASLDAAVKAAKDTSPGQVKAKEEDTLYMKRNVRDTEHSLSVPFGGNSPSGTHSPVSSLPSASYEELVNKYCFFGSAAKQSNPSVKDDSFQLRMPGGRDSPKLGIELQKSSASRRDGSPPSHRHVGNATHHTLHYGSISPYFHAYHVTPSSTFSTATNGGVRPEATPPSMSPNLGRTTPPLLASGAGTPASDSMSERFPWTADTHAAPAIQG